MLHKGRLFAIIALLAVVGLVEFGFVTPTHAQGTCNGARWEEINGYAYIETESVQSISGGWERRTNSSGRFANYTGTGYMFYNGASTGGSVKSNAEGGLLEYPIRINNPGTYIIRWYNVNGIGTSTSESNDSWLKVTGIPVENFYGIDESDPTAPIVYPRDTGLSPNPDGASDQGFFKVYSNSITGWKWDGRTFDRNGHAIFADFDNPGTYTIQVSGRSQGHSIDRIVLYRVNINRNSSESIENQVKNQRNIAEDINKSEVFCVNSNNPAPEITQTDPANNETEVPVGSNLSLTLSEPVFGTGNGSLSFVCQPGNVQVGFSLEVPGNNVYVFNPTSDLPKDATCTFSASTSAVRDADGANLVDNDGNNNGTYTLSFSTETSPPEITETVPAIDDTGVKVDSAISITLNTLALDAAALPSLTCDGNGQTYSIAPDTNKANTFLFTPNSPLPFDVDCTLAIDTSTITRKSNNTELVDNDGDNESGVYNLTFSTEIQPQIVSTDPVEGAQGVQLDTTLTVVASEILIPTGQGSVNLTCDGNIITYSLDAAQQPTYVLTPNSPLPAGVACEFMIPVGAVRDSDGNSLLDSDMTDDDIFTLSFTTVSPVDAAGASVEQANGPMIEGTN